MKNPEKRFRLRQGEKITGYMRKVSDVMVMYSADGFWWTGRPIAYDELDEWVGLRDKNNRHIYEWDLLHFKLDPDDAYSLGALLWEANSQQFGIKGIKEEVFVPLEVNGVPMFNPRQLEVYSYLFINPQLKEKLGVQEG